MRVIIYGKAPVARPAPRPRTYQPRQRYQAPRPKPPPVTMVPVPEFMPDGTPNPEYKPGAMMPAPAAPGTPEPGPAPAPPSPVIPAAQRTGIALIGDSLADALAGGLEADDAFKAEFALKTRTVSASGLVRDDFHDWPKTLAAMLQEQPQPKAVVVMVGLNDRQILRAGNENLAPLTPAWRDAYAKRVEAVINTAKAAKVPLVWVGLPAMRAAPLSADLAQINAMIRDHVNGAGETFVEIFDGFADASGGFSATGPDVIGDTVRLRGPDGIHFTPAGQRKLAFFLDKPLRKRLELGLRNATPALEATPEKNDKDISIPLPAPKAVTAPAPQIPARIRPDVGEVRALTAAPMAPALTGTLAPQQDPATDALFRQGLSPAPRSGRADDYRWK